MNNSFLWPITRLTQLFEPDELVIGQLERVLGLTYQRQQDPKSTSLCYVNSDEVRDEYKTVFSSVDLLNYVTAIRKSAVLNQSNSFRNSDGVLIMYPRNSAMFWKLVKLGSDIMKEQSSNNVSSIEIIAAINAAISES